MNAPTTRLALLTILGLMTASILCSASASVAQMIVVFEPVEPAETCDTCPAYMVVQSDARWKYSPIPVCWEREETEVAKADKMIVQNAVARTWGKHSVMSFTGWDECDDDSSGIRISVRDSYTKPQVLNYGHFLDGTKNGIQLNFNLYNTGQWHRCFNRREWCIEVQAIHEFGHAMGFHHEQRRSDIKNVAPDCAADHPNLAKIQEELILTEYDENSVMNYCNPRWAGYGRLSEKDIAGFKAAYDNNPMMIIFHSSE